MVVLHRELYDDLAYKGLPRDEAVRVEEKIKQKYEIIDYISDKGIGYQITDKRNSQEIYFSPNSRLTLETRYLEKDANKNVTENVLDLMARVAVNIASADKKYDPEANIQARAEEFLELMIYQEFMPNTPTLCNAGRSLQQLSACFVLPVDDHMATDDIGEDPEKQGRGIYDTLRNAAMVHKSGGGTGFNFSNLRPKGDLITTTFGASSGPVSFIKSFDAATEAVNQGGFRRGANMGILEYWHPDIFEFVYEKTKGTLNNFNLSVGVDAAFIEAAKNNGYFRLVNPKDQNNKALEERLYRTEQLIQLKTFTSDSEEAQRYANEYKEKEKQMPIEELVEILNHEGYYSEIVDETFKNVNGLDEDTLKELRETYERDIISQDMRKDPIDFVAELEQKRRYRKKAEEFTRDQKEEYNRKLDEMGPSIVLSEDNKVILRYNNKVVGKVGDRGEVLIDANYLFDFIADRACNIGCPGVVFLDKMEYDNPTPRIGRIKSTNPCGEQPLLPDEACNLGAINLASCVENGEFNWNKLERLAKAGVRFLDNVIDMSKFPFKRIYAQVKGNRKIGLGMMGLAETLFGLGIKYDSEEGIDFGRKVSKILTEKAREASCELTEERGVFPNWKGSVYDPEAEFSEKYKIGERRGLKIRNATVTTIAPNGTTGMIANVSGGIEPLFSHHFTKVCMDGRRLEYRSDAIERIIEESGIQNRRRFLLDLLKNRGSIQNLDYIPDNLKALYKTAHDIGYKWHVRMQAAIQEGVDNAVSKTVNMPAGTTSQEVREIYQWAYENGCKGITIYVDGSHSSQPLQSSTADKKTLENIMVIQNEVENIPQILDPKANVTKYKIHRHGGSLHVIFTHDLYIDDKSGRAYWLPAEDFQCKAPLGEKTTVDFAQEGMDRTVLFENEDPDYAELIARWKSAASNEAEGIGPKKVKSTHHAVGVALEYDLLRHGVVGYDEAENLVSRVRKADLRKATTEETQEILRNQNGTNGSKIRQLFTGNVKLGEIFECRCGSTEYTFKDGCHAPACAVCGNIPSGACG